MPPRDPRQSILGQLPATLEHETRVMSGGFEKLDAFRQVIALGEIALSELVEGIRGAGWWRMQAIWTIAHTIGRPIQFPEEVKGKYTEVQDHIIKWAKDNSYIEDERS